MGGFKQKPHSPLYLTKELQLAQTGQYSGHQTSARVIGKEPTAQTPPQIPLQPALFSPQKSDCKSRTIKASAPLIGTKQVVIITSIGRNFNEIFCHRIFTTADLTLLQHQIRTKTIRLRP